jgi:hypothetical protein
VARSLLFFPVDVFANVANDENLDEDVMRAIAREFNQSETTFVQASTGQSGRVAAALIHCGAGRGRRSGPQHARRLVVAARRGSQWTRSRRRGAISSLIEQS